jgi:hypothetical protein
MTVMSWLPGACIKGGRERAELTNLLQSPTLVLALLPPSSLAALSAMQPVDTLLQSGYDLTVPVNWPEVFGDTIAYQPSSRFIAEPGIIGACSLLIAASCCSDSLIDWGVLPPHRFNDWYEAYVEWERYQSSVVPLEALDGPDPSPNSDALWATRLCEGELMRQTVQAELDWPVASPISEAAPSPSPSAPVASVPAVDSRVDPPNDGKFRLVHVYVLVAHSYNLSDTVELALTGILQWKEPKSNNTLNKVSGYEKREQSLAGSFNISEASTRCDFVEAVLVTIGLRANFAPDATRGPAVKIVFHVSYVHFTSYFVFVSLTMMQRRSAAPASYQRQLALGECSTAVTQAP